MSVEDKPSQRLLSAVAVVRHAERADAVWGHPWNTSADAASFPFDPPITAAGAQMAAQRAKDLTSSGTHFDVVVSSPYLRAIQTALVLAEHLDAIVILDHQLGEVLGPKVFGDDGPNALPWRTRETLMLALKSCDEVPVDLMRLQHEQIFGEPPVWPESMGAARMRYAARYLTYLRRGRLARMSCLLVTHGHMVQASLRVLPATSPLEVDSVGYCATVVAQVYKRDVQVSCPATVDRDLAEVGDGFAGSLDGGELSSAKPLNDAALQEMTFCWWEASMHGVTYQGDEGTEFISNSTTQHRGFLAKLQHHLDWSWNRVECLLGALRPLEETLMPLSEGVQGLALPSSPADPKSIWNRNLSSGSSADSGFDRFVSNDSFCQLVSSPNSPICRKQGGFDGPSSPNSPIGRKQRGFDSPSTQRTHMVAMSAKALLSSLTRLNSMQGELCMKCGPDSPLIQETRSVVTTPSESSTPTPSILDKLRKKRGTESPLTRAARIRASRSLPRLATPKSSSQNILSKGIGSMPARCPLDMKLHASGLAKRRQKSFEQRLSV